MAAATSSSSAALVRAVVLPLMLVLLAVAAGASIAEDGPAVAKSGGPLSETPVGRKLLQDLRLCGAGSAPDFNCKVILGVGAFNATCCTDSLGNEGCWDVGAFWLDKCGSCNTACKVGDVCCYGTCVNLLTDKNNCGACRNKCSAFGLNTCNTGFCGY